MNRVKLAVMLLSVALVAALIGHVVIDVLGDFLLAHDDYDDVDHSSRTIVALVTLGLAMLGVSGGLRAAIREARGSENAFCLALRSALPRNDFVFSIAAIALSTIVLCTMEAADATLAGQRIDDIGDLFAGSIPFGATIIAIVAAIVSLTVLGIVRRLAQFNVLAIAVVAFLRRCLRAVHIAECDVDVVDRLVYHAHHICRRIAGRAPPLHLLAAS